MSGWRRCDSCRKVKAAEEFDGEATTCRACLTSPTPTPRRKPAVVSRTAAPRSAPAPVARGPRLGSVGSGDLEVRERRARRAAFEALAEVHPEEFVILLRDARAAEGLRPLSAESAPPPPEGA